MVTPHEDRHALCRLAMRDPGNDARPLHDLSQVAQGRIGMGEVRGLRLRHIAEVGDLVTEFAQGLDQACDAQGARSHFAAPLGSAGLERYADELAVHAFGPWGRCGLPELATGDEEARLKRG